MQHLKLSALLFAIAPLALASVARADEPSAEPAGPQVTEVDPNQPEPPLGQQEMMGPPPNGGAPEENPIPPNVEGQATPAQGGGGYCFGGPHPAPGGGWEATTSPHMHDYAPFDLRLFAFHDGCYYFIGDPKDFGYTGESYSYYGAHPILDAYGGGWCFMIGAHTHWWRPWSANFTVVGPWYYWNGPYDPFFWSYWPYYSFFYRGYYPSYYAGGRFFRTWRAAPPISHVPATGWRGGATGAWRGSPAGVSRANGVHGAGPLGGAWRGSPGNGYRAAPPAGGGWHGSPTTNGGNWNGGGGWRGSPVPSPSAPRAAPYNGGWGGGYRPAPSTGGGWHPAPSGGGWHSAPSGGGWHSAPSGGGWHGSPGGGFHGGGGGGGFHSGGGFRGGRH